MEFAVIPWKGHVSRSEIQKSLTSEQLLFSLEEDHILEFLAAVIRMVEVNKRLELLGLNAETHRIYSINYTPLAIAHAICQ